MKWQDRETQQQRSKVKPTQQTNEEKQAGLHEKDQSNDRKVDPKSLKYNGGIDKQSGGMDQENTINV